MPSSDEIINLGDAAQSLILSNPFKVALESLRYEGSQNWMKSKPEDQVLREDMYYLCVAISFIEERLQAMINNAKMERNKVEKPNHLRVVPVNEDGE